MKVLASGDLCFWFIYPLVTTLVPPSVHPSQHLLLALPQEGLFLSPSPTGIEPFLSLIFISFNTLFRFLILQALFHDLPPYIFDSATPTWSVFVPLTPPL